jgi:hypothetical protein
MLRGISKSGENLDSSLSPQGKRSFSDTFLLAKILWLSKIAEDAIEAALFDPEPVFQSLNHLPIGHEGL